jgi:cytoskeletal protein RodZ
MDSLGKYLKEQRESLKLSVEDVAQTTRLKTYTINQIENDDFKAIGDVGFIKIIVITYCRAIQGNEEIIHKKLTRLFDQPLDPPIKINTAKNVKPVMFSMNIIYFSLLGVLAVVLAFALFTIYQKGTFSFTAIKNQLASIERKNPRQNMPQESDPDSLWSFQRDIFHETNSISSEIEKPEFKPERTTIFVKSDKSTTALREFNTSRQYISDKNDYVGRLIFGDEPSPLNPEL